MDFRLQKEVRWITTRLGKMIEEQAGMKTFQRIEKMRKTSKELRVAGSPAREKSMVQMLKGLKPEQAYDVAHAFTLFFHLVNLCEERQRVRALQANPEPNQSLKKLFRELHHRRLNSRQFQHCLDEMEIQPVLTSHPTEAKRQTVVHQILRLNSKFEDPDEILEAMWQTDQVRSSVVTPMDEVARVMYWFESTILDTLSNFGRHLDQLLKDFYPDVSLRRPILSFASWVGGDRDGNEFVTPEVSLKTLESHYQVILKYYLSQCDALLNELSHTENGVRLVPAHDGRKNQPAGEGDLFRVRIHHLKSRLMEDQLDSATFLKELRDLQSRLFKQGAHRASQGRIQTLIRMVQVFGFHLAELDFRGHSARLHSEPDAMIAELKTIAQIQKKYGLDAADHYILSMTHEANDVKKLLRLSQRAGVTHLHIVPLFETIDDLERSSLIMSQLWNDPEYRDHLNRQGKLQEVMFGYSDSNKDGGYFAANWWLYVAQKKMVETADSYGIRLRMFHGKGGTIDRGGGQSYRSIRAQPQAVGSGKIRITEQGEVIALKYSNPVIAQRNLEQLTTAAIEAHLCTRIPGSRNHLVQWEEAMSEVSHLSMNYYRKLIYETPGFESYFWSATPIDLIDRLRIGSRPSRRRMTRDIRQLRTIPWVFAWIQSRHLISAWYGVGYALQEYGRRHEKGLDILRDMYLDWPFFTTLMDNVEISLAKVDMQIASKYASLEPDVQIRESIFGMIRDEYERSVEWTLQVCGLKKLLQNQPVLSESIRLRNPYVDPLNYLQIHFLPQWRRERDLEHPQKSDRLFRLLSLTVNGIAHGMKSTG